MTTKPEAAPAIADAAPSLSGGPTAQVARHTVNDPSTVWTSPTQGPGLYRSEDHRYWFNGEGPRPSVTTILKVMDKPAVTQWVARETARAAWLNPPGFYDPGVGTTAPIDQEEYVSFVMSQPRDKADTAAKLGSYVHLLADMAPRSPQDGPGGFEIDPVALPFITAFRGFLDRYSASSIISSEKAVFSSEGYAGTYDLLMRIDGALWLLDIKTSKGYYPEFALQLAAYGHADFIALEGDPVQYPMPPVDRYGVLHLRPDQYPDTGWRLIEYPVTDRDFVAFLAALELWQWKGEGRFTKSILQKTHVPGNGIQT